MLKSFIRSSTAVRRFTTSRLLAEANNFGMPALSPTMTEGGIVEWKFKEGDSYNAGDILLEIETDKAQIDVEAQDDGKIAKIYVQNGEKGIPVGKTIAVIAEPEDDLSSLTLPEPVAGGPAAAPAAPAAPAPPATPAASAKEAAPASSAETTAPATSDSISQKTNIKQTLLPSVLSLALNNNMTPEQVIADVPASGPNGRILKGDILAYLGKISKSDVESITSEITKLQHLDLSNIKVKKAEPQEAPKKVEEKSASKEVTPTKSADKPKPAPPVVLNGLFTLTEIETFRKSLSASTGSAPSVKSVVEKASKLASRDVPLFSQPKRSVLNDPVFDSLIAPSNRGLKPFEVSIEYPRAAGVKKNSAKQDIFDLLAAAPKRSSARVVSADVLNVSVTVNKKYVGGEAKAKVFLDRFGFYLSREGLGELTL